MKTITFNNCGFISSLEVVLQEHHQDRSRAAAETAGIYLSVYLCLWFNICLIMSMFV